MGKRRTMKPEPSGPSGSLHGAVVADTLDLHGENSVTAERRLESFLVRYHRTQPGAVVRVITGRGTRSEDGPVLPGIVTQLLDGGLQRYVSDFTVDHGGGAYLVRVRE